MIVVPIDPVARQLREEAVVLLAGRVAGVAHTSMVIPRTISVPRETP
jgi:hypothetical protein